ncbi:MAG: hypothetical protein ACK559_41930, partial [bacterium]
MAGLLALALGPGLGAAVEHLEQHAAQRAVFAAHREEGDLQEPLLHGESAGDHRQGLFHGAEEARIPEQLAHLGGRGREQPRVVRQQLVDAVVLLRAGEQAAQRGRPGLRQAPVRAEDREARVEAGEQRLLRCSKTREGGVGGPQIGGA